jgi:hypothetical protein
MLTMVLVNTCSTEHKNGTIIPMFGNEYTPAGRKTCIDQGKDGLQTSMKREQGWTAYILLLLLMVKNEYATDQRV